MSAHAPGGILGDAATPPCKVQWVQQSRQREAGAGWGGRAGGGGAQEQGKGKHYSQFVCAFGSSILVKNILDYVKL